MPGRPHSATPDPATNPRRAVARRAAVLVAALPLFAVALAGAAALTGPAPDGPTDGLPTVNFPAQNPFSEEKRILGKMLFWDEQLSSDNTVACATCHTPEFGGADPRRLRHPGVDGILQTPDDVFGSPGILRANAAGDYERDPAFGLGPQATNRAAPSAINAAFSPELFWDGRARSTFTNPQTGQVSIPAGGALESQSVGPPLSSVEMAHAGRNWDQVAAKLAGAVPLAVAADLPPDVRAAAQAWRTYPALFHRAFGSPAITAERIAFAIATYERTLVSDQTPWDALIAGNPNALTPAQQQGLQEFNNHRCALCHTPPTFSNNTFRNVGLRPPGDDPGRQAVTGAIIDARRFKVPTLRNVSLRAEFMHTGQFTTLTQVLNFYANGAQQFPQNRDPLIPIPMSNQDRQSIITFITGGLLDPRVAAAQAPFDHPTLFTRRANTSAVPIGAGTPGSGGNTPIWIATSPPNVGNADFKLGVMNALGGATARLYLSATPPVNNQVGPDTVIGPVTLSGVGPGLGLGTAHWPIPADPTLRDAVRYAQWVIDDPAAAGGQARTQPLRLTLFCGEAGCPTSCAADCNADGFLSIADYICFQTRFALGDPWADCDGNGVRNINDYTCFQTRFALGCP